MPKHLHPSRKQDAFIDDGFVYVIVYVCSYNFAAYTMMEITKPSLWHLFMIRQTCPHICLAQLLFPCQELEKVSSGFLRFTLVTNDTLIFTYIQGFCSQQIFCLSRYKRLQYCCKNDCFFSYAYHYAQIRHPIHISFTPLCYNFLLY